MSSELERDPATTPLLVARLSALGDVLHTLPAVLSIRKAFPRRPIGWIVEEPYSGLLEAIGVADRVFSIRTRLWRRAPLSAVTRRDFWDSVRAVRDFATGGDFIDFQGLMKSAAWGVLSRSRRRFGFDSSLIREKPALIPLSHPVEIDSSGHVVELNMRLARAATGSELEEESIDLSVFEREPESRLQEVMENRPPVLLPATGRSAKNWPAEKFIALAERIHAGTALSSVVLWGPGEESTARAITERSPGAILAPPTSLAELVWTLRRSRMVVGGDTGPLHIAAAAGSPVTALFGPTSPERNGPWGQLDRVVTGVDGRMESITVDDVSNRVLDGLMAGLQ